MFLSYEWLISEYPVIFVAFYPKKDHKGHHKGKGGDQIEAQGVDLHDMTRHGPAMLQEIELINTNYFVQFNWYFVTLV